MRLRSRFSRCALSIASCVAFACVRPEWSNAQVARIEVHPIQTLTLPDEQVLTGAHDGKPATIAGELRIPRVSADRLPAVVLVHGSGGIGANYDRWSAELNGLGIATFIVDGFTGRAIASTVEDQEQLGRLTMIYDVYRALAVLAAHPRIDPTRIAILGGSRGGQIALYASLKRFQRAYGRPGVEFAAYLVLYAPCNTTYIEDTDVSDRPIRLFHGDADDYNPVAPCRAYVERLRAAGKDVQLTEYPDTHHVFDNALFSTTPVLWPRAQTTRRCVLKEEPMGRIINAETGAPFTYADPCVERGVHIAYNPAAHAATLRAVKEFLRATFKLN
ncbi:MAG TPA: dienelactone hydrolase family protein [Gemmatimonadales bacterium]|nr:dienelactone hydrolase family protein [Gemmatimonadales bacterium]